jgi:hypothetical protein
MNVATLILQLQQMAEPNDEVISGPTGKAGQGHCSSTLKSEKPSDRKVRS